MIKNSFKLLLIFLLIKIPVLFAKEYAPVHIIQVEGVANIENDIKIAEEAAIKDALRKAVEEIVSIFFLAAQTIVKNSQLIEDNIYTYSKDYIENYKIIDKKQEEGVYKVKLEVVVSSKQIKNQIKNKLKQIKLLAENPRIIFLSYEEIMGKESKVSFCESILSKHFLEKGFKVIEMTQMERIKKEDMLRYAMDDIKLATALGVEYGAEVVIINKVVVGVSESMVLEGLKSAKANIILKAVNCDTARIILETSDSSTGIDIDKITAAKKAIDKCINKLAPIFIDNLIKKWQEEFLVGRLINIVISNIEFADLKKLEKLLREDIPGVENVWQRSYRRLAKLAIWDIKYRGKTTELAKQLNQKAENIKKQIIIVEITPNSLDIKIK